MSQSNREEFIRRLDELTHFAATKPFRGATIAHQALVSLRGRNVLRKPPEARRTTPIADRLYDREGRRYRDSGDIDSDRLWGGPDRDRWKTRAEWAELTDVVTS